MRPGLEFTRASLAVRYRGDIGPQLLDVHVVTDRPPEVAFGPPALAFLAEAVSLGGGGGAEFPPSAGAARVLHGPRDTTGLTHAVWRLEVSAMSPRFLRTIVERLSSPGPEATVTSMMIAGSLPPDTSPLSVSEGTLSSWLDDDDAHPAVWPAPGFPIRDRPIPSGACIRLRLAGSADHECLLRFTRLIEMWNQAILHVTNSSGEYVGVTDATPRMSRGATELAAGYDAFDFYRPPVRAILLNMLTRFHEQVVPIAEAELALP